MTAITRKKPDASAVLNAVSTEALQAFFDAKEQFFYYRQFNNPSRRRDFAASFIGSVEHFLLVSSGALEAIFELHVRPRAKPSSARSPFAALQSEWDRFSEFFDAAAMTDLVAAKSAYRRAARILHPDTGGNAADMVALNAAFAQLLDILMLREAEAALQPNVSTDRTWNDGTRGGSSFACGFVSPGFWPGSILQYPRSAQEFEILLRSEALLAAIDIFDEDRHAELALGLRFNPAWVVEGDPSWEAFDKAGACERLADIVRIAIEATRVADLTHGLPGLREVGEIWMQAAIDGWIKHGRISARESASNKKVQEREEKAIAAGRYPFVDEWREKQLRALSERLDDPGSRADDRFQLNHFLQAENAFRRGLVTAARYKTTMERLEGKQDALAVAGAAVADLSTGSGFMALEHDPIEAEKAVSVRFVPEIIAGSAFGNWKLNSTQACRAYGEAYYRSDKVEGKLKFVRQRLWILLSSLVANPERWDTERIGAAAHEVELLEKAARAGREGQAGDHAADLHAFLTTLATEAAAERENRLEILGRLAREDFRDSLPEGIEPVLGNAQSRGLSSEWSPLTHVIPSPDYYRAAMLPLNELEKLGAGKAWSDPEWEAQQDGVSYYYDHMQKLSERMFKAVDIEPAEKKIVKLAPLIRQAIDQGVPLNAAGEWQLGYYIDKLTGAMVRARQFAEAAVALEEYFVLPEAYRRRSAASEDKTLRARLTRCQRDATRC
ncbi:MAG: hypothetical protein H2055_00935 [Sphingopyxis sp.]|nr:hypothetical protein [Sphingopyxis sp.]